MQHAASAIFAPDTDQPPVYWQFYDAVARAQLRQWLPSRRHLLVDISGPRSPAAELAAQAGHKVVRVLDAGLGQPPAPLTGRSPSPGPPGGRSPSPGGTGG
ncbi:MAG TPA: hypothetical protein VE888_15040, partial [Streptosporangiaceae bacterium]|nr:hypothetical protein [Streptosporangiaceae bacterium]